MGEHTSSKDAQIASSDIEGGEGELKKKITHF